MAEFCKCGSLIIDNQCTNKNCASRTAGKPAGTVKKNAAGIMNKEARKNPRRSSKVVTYNIYQTDPEKPE